MNDYLGEFLGTMVLILMGGGVVAGVLLAKSKAQNAGWMVVTAGWAFGVMAGIYTAKAIGAPGFINPVGPLAGVLTGSLAVEKALGFVAAEFAGAFTGAVLVWLHYLPHWAETTDPGASSRSSAPHRPSATFPRTWSARPSRPSCWSLSARRWWRRGLAARSLPHWAEPSCGESA